MKDWNYRVVKYPDYAGKQVFGISRVYYYDEHLDKPRMMGPALITSDSVAGLSALIQQMKSGLDKIALSSAEVPENPYV